MPTFPQINADGFMADRGSTFADSYLTTTTDPGALTGRVAWAWRGAGLDGFSSEPLGKWSLQFGSLTDAERGVLEAFFRARRGRLEAFRFLDPYGNLVATSEPSPGASDPFGGARATSGGSYSSVVIPGDAAGFVVTASAWVKASAGGSATVAVAGASRTWDLPAGVWRRCWCTATIGSSGAVSMSVNGGDVHFGYQCVPLPGPAAYVRSPGRAGLREKVRFDQDRLDFRTLQKGVHSTTISLIETH